ncbi:hypothetical protein ACQP2T_40585 [Nonomuraea sp. CA-143628]|uniref:hypothetical protein n=1 Tax=Nonomuraea sp. CA-143628 TaxID=3239997 RepID=UPI003D94D79B
MISGGASIEGGTAGQAPNGTPKSAVVACQNPAQRIVGTGTGIGNGGQQDQVIPMAVFPSAGLDQATGRAAEDESGLATPWDMDLFLVCVD